MEYVFVDRDTYVPMFTVKNADNLSQKDVAFQLALDATDRRRTLSSYMLLKEDSLSFEKILQTAHQLRPERLGKAIATHVTSNGRSREILALVVHGLTNKEIAARLGIALRTVKFYVSQLLAQYQVPSRTKLALIQESEKTHAAGNESLDRVAG